ncbi:MAG TPA: M48 family metallopeptidase [Solimonas sp.]|nr:M48 family metallopeptidase [Solimonas sp.]
MNFFQNQARARSQSRRLVWLFLLAVVAVVGVIDLAVLVAMNLSAQEPGPLLRRSAGSGHVLLGCSIATLLVIAVSSIYKWIQVRGGGGAIAQALGGRIVSGDVRDPRLRRLRNVVEEMAIASGVPAPEVYVLDGEPGINAFAAGFSPSDAAIAVTRGALDKLSRDELQGMIAHEFSHVLNGDMRLNLRLMGLLFGILVIAIIGRKVVRGSMEADDIRFIAAGAAAGVAIMLIGYVGYFFGQLLKAAVSRQREYLADASAVQFTRQTAGLAGALKKVAGVRTGSKLVSREREDVSHMLFGDGVGYSSLFATHPPLLDRIRTLEPAFSARELAALPKRWSDDWVSLLDDDVPGSAISAAVAPGPGLALAPEGVSAHVGQPDDADMRLGEIVRAALPAPLRSAAHDPSLAPALIAALLLDGDEVLRARQLAMLGEEPAAGASGLYPQVRELHPSQRLPLAALALPALRRRPAGELAALLGLVGRLVQADGRISAFEYCLSRLLRLQIGESLRPSASRAGGRRTLDRCTAELQTAFGVLAQQGHADPALARAACLAGLQRALPRAALAYAPPDPWGPALDRALDVLDQLAPPGKELLVEGLVTTLSHDGRITVAEAELLRVVCAALHCPLPARLEAGPG